MIIRVLSKKFYLRVGSPLWWTISLSVSAFFFVLFMRILWLVG